MIYRFPQAAARMLAGCLLLMMASPMAAAMWAGLSDAELAAQSDLIVLGEIVGTRTTARPGGQAPLDAAVIRISGQLKGSGNPGEALLALPPAGAPRSSTDIFYRVGQKGLWFLRAHPGPGLEGVYLADHPQRFIPAGQAEKIEAFRRLLSSPPGQAR